VVCLAQTALRVQLNGTADPTNSVTRRLLIALAQRLAPRLAVPCAALPRSPVESSASARGEGGEAATAEGDGEADVDGRPAKKRRTRGVAAGGSFYLASGRGMEPTPSFFYFVSGHAPY
jgi:hypothetical protein